MISHLLGILCNTSNKSVISKHPLFSISFCLKVDSHRSVVHSWVSTNTGLKFNPLLKFLYFCMSVSFKTSDTKTTIHPDKICVKIFPIMLTTGSMTKVNDRASKQALVLMTAIFLIGVIIATLWFAFMLVLSGSYENSDEESDGDSDEQAGTIGTCKIPI